MPRGKRKKKKKVDPVKSTPSPQTKDLVDSFETYDLDVETYGLDRLHSFMRARDDIITIAYRVPTVNLTKDGLVAKYRGEMISAIQNFVRNRRQIISVQHIHIDALPLGSEALIKAWAYMKDVGGKVKRRNAPPEDPLDWAVKGVKL